MAHDLTLAEEARYLHHSLFPKHRVLDPKIVQRYEKANLALFPDHRLTRIVTSKLDVAAVEFALRRRRRCPELTRKIQILSYLVEIHPDYQDDFIASKREPLGAVLGLFWQIPRSVWMLFKGECLVRLYGLL